METGTRPGGRRGPRNQPNPGPSSSSDGSYQENDIASDDRSSGADHFDDSSDEHGQPTRQSRGLNPDNSIPIDINDPDPEPEAMSVDTPNATTEQYSSPERPAPPRAPLHSIFDKVCTKNAKCDQCEQRNTSAMQKCRTCGMTTCKTCHERGRYDSRHSLDGLVLDWEPLVRDKRGRSIGTQSIRGITKGRRGRPSRPPGASKAGLGLVRESVPYVKERSLATASVAGLSKIGSGNLSDDQNTLEDSDEEYSPTPEEFSNRASNHQDRDGGEEADTVHVRARNDVRQDRVGPRTVVSQGTRGSSQRSSTLQGRKALPTARPKQTSSRPPLPSARPTDTTPSAPPLDLREIAKRASRVTRRLETDVHQRGVPDRYAHSALQSGQLDNRARAPTAPSLRRSVLESVTRRPGREIPPPPQSPSTAPGLMDLDDEPQSQVELGTPSERGFEGITTRSLGYDHIDDSTEILHGADDDERERSSPAIVYQPGSATARQSQRLASIRSLGILSRPNRPTNEQAYGGQARELTGTVYSQDERLREGSGRVSLSGSSYYREPNPAILRQIYQGRIRGSHTSNRWRSLVSQLELDWRNNPIIAAERNANGPLAALDMQEASVILESMRRGMPRESARFWFSGMRAALRHS